MRKFNLFLTGILFLMLFMSSQLLSQNIKYKITDIINLDGEGKWDYLAMDYTFNRLYVTHETRVHIIDLKNYSIIGEIKDLNSIHGVAIVPELNKGYISNGVNDNVTVFDTKTFKIMNNVRIPGKMPDAIIYEPYTKRIFTFNGGSNNATALDVLTDKIAGTITLDGKPEF